MFVEVVNMTNNTQFKTLVNTWLNHKKPMITPSTHASFTLIAENHLTIIGNCDSSIFLGGKEPTTLKELSQSLGKETIDTYNTVSPFLSLLR